MAKTLVLVRHAKSAWPDGVPDHDRPLSERGRRDAPALGRWLREQGIVADLAVVSTARRARETFELAAAELDPAPKPLITDSMYGASTGDLLDTVRELPAAVSVALLIGHNPGIGTLAAVLDEQAGSAPVFKTSAVAVYEVGPSWPEVNPGMARLLASSTPRG
ncbi:MAG TPA: histidine phosphatase family protein [Jiangellales bacterium]|nr:histidine phosphatase family protein [Jiangellales bacterium]